MSVFYLSLYFANFLFKCVFFFKGINSSSPKFQIICSFIHQNIEDRLSPAGHCGDTAVGNMVIGFMELTVQEEKYCSLYKGR